MCIRDSFRTSDEDERRVVEALAHLDSGENLEAYIDVDEVLRYFAANVFLVNLDSYLSNLKHNYYLYEEDGRLSMLPWDYNLSFGAHQLRSASDAVNFPIDDPYSGTSAEKSPILQKLLEVCLLYTSIMISSELQEVLRMSDRVVCMCEGRLTKILDIQDASQEVIMKYATMRN